MVDTERGLQQVVRRKKLLLRQRISASKKTESIVLVGTDTDLVVQVPRNRPP